MAENLSERKQASLTEFIRRVREANVNTTHSLWGILLSGQNAPTTTPTEMVVQQPEVPHENMAFALLRFLFTGWNAATTGQNAATTGQNAAPTGHNAPPTGQNAAGEVPQQLEGAGGNGGWDHRLDTVLLKFLEFNNFKLEKATRMLNQVVTWRGVYGTDTISNEHFDDIIPTFGDLTFIQGTDMHNRPLMYVRYGAIKDIVKARDILLDDFKRIRFVRWRVQIFERAIKTMLDFNTGGVHSVVEITDLNGIPEVGLEKAVEEYEQLMARYYPGLIDRRIYINSEWYTYAKALVSYPFLIRTDRICKNITFTGSKPAGILCKYIHPHHILVEYGGMCKQKENPWGIDRKPSRKDSVKAYETVEIRITSIREGITASWEFLVIGWDVSYGVRFQPVQGRPTLVALDQHLASPNTVIKDTFECPAAGDLVIKVDNSKSDKSKIVAWRCYFEE